MIPQEAVEAAEQAIRKEMESQAYDRHTYTRIVLEAAAPYLRAQALEDAAQELVRLHGIGRTAQGKCTPEEKADYYAYAEHDGDHSTWLKARAAAERGAA